MENRKQQCLVFQYSLTIVKYIGPSYKGPFKIPRFSGKKRICLCVSTYNNNFLIKILCPE